MATPIANLEYRRKPEIGHAEAQPVREGRRDYQEATRKSRWHSPNCNEGEVADSGRNDRGSRRSELTKLELVTASMMNTHVRDQLSYLFDAGYEVDVLNTTDITTTSTTFTDITGFSLAVTTYGEDLVFHFEAQINILSSSAGTGGINFDFTVDGTRWIGDDGIGLQYTQVAPNPQTAEMIQIHRKVTGLSAGAHTFVPQWKVRAAAGTPTGTLYAGDGTTLGRDTHPTCWISKA